MRFRRYTIIILLIVSILSACTPTVTSEDNIMTTMKTLTSNEYQGRMTGTEGNEKATLYIEDQFRKIGLEPYYEDSYFHEFEYISYVSEEKRSDLVIEYEDGSKEALKLGTDYVNLTLGNKKGEVIFPLTTDINDKDINDKIVLLEDNNNLTSVLSKARGMILKIEDLRKGLTSPSELYSFAVKPEIYQRLVANKAVNIIYTSNYTKEQSTANNVIGIIKGTRGDKAVILSAHFDHVGTVGEAIFRGAIDNASGTSVLLDLAQKLYKQSLKKPFQMDIIFTAFNGEELGLIGSEKFAREIKDEHKYKSLYNINIDCVGSKSGGPIYLDNEDHTSKELIDAIKPYLADKSLDYKDGYYGLSDNHSFVIRDIPGITIGQGELEYIHTEADTLDDVDYDYLSRVSDAIFNFIIENDGKEFNQVTSTDGKFKKGEPPKEEWSNAFKRFRELSEEKNIQYDEEIQFLSDGYLFKGDGNRSLIDLDEIKRYYPNMEIINNLIGYDFNHIDIKQPMTGLNVIYVIGQRQNEDMENKKKRDISIKNFAEIEIEYEHNEDTLLTKIINPNIYRTVLPDYVEKVNLDGGLKDYSLLVQIKGNKVIEARGLYKKVGNLDIYMDFFTKQRGKDYYMLDYNKTEDELMEIIKEIEKDNIIEDLIEKLGI